MSNEVRSSVHWRTIECTGIRNYNRDCVVDKEPEVTVKTGGPDQALNFLSQRCKKQHWEQRE